MTASTTQQGTDHLCTDPLQWVATFTDDVNFDYVVHTGTTLAVSGYSPSLATSSRVSGTSNPVAGSERDKNKCRVPMSRRPGSGAGGNSHDAATHRWLLDTGPHQPKIGLAVVIVMQRSGVTRCKSS